MTKNGIKKQLKKLKGGNAKIKIGNYSFIVKVGRVKGKRVNLQFLGGEGINVLAYKPVVPISLDRIDKAEPI